MELDRQRVVIARLLEHLRNGTTDLESEAWRNPVSDYVSDEHCDAERRMLGEGVGAVGLGADAPSPGDYFTAWKGDIPLLVVRGRDGVLRAFVNACRHRAGRLAEGRGSFAGDSITCPIHAWTYATSGALLRQPNAAGGFDGLDRAALGLRPVPTAEARGLVLVGALGGPPVDPRQELGEMGGDLAALSLDRHHFFAERSVRWKCNWKLALSTFLESYHVFSLHRQSVDRWYLSHPMTVEAFGAHLCFPVVRRTVTELESRPMSQWSLLPHASVQYWIAPDTLLNYTLDHLVAWRFRPLSPGACEATAALYTPVPVGDDDGRRHFDRSFSVHLDTAGQEDFPAQEGVQASLASGAVDELVFGRNEIGLIHMHRVLRELLDTRASR